MLRGRRAGACPPPCLCCDERSRGTGPRATVRPTRWNEHRLFTVGRGPVPRRACIAMNVREGQALALRLSRRGLLHAQDRPSLAPLCRLRSPDRNRVKIRHSWTTGYGNRTFARDRPSRYGDREIARDRPSRYGVKAGTSYRRARACPSPCN